MEDVRSLVSREPPEGLTAWGPVREALNVFGLTYEMEWVEDYGFEYLLGPMAQPRRVKMVRTHCSCCGEDALLPWAKTTPKQGGYGFVMPDDFPYGDIGFSPVCSGDEGHCPLCDAPVKVKKAAEIGGGHYVLAETSAVSASVVGERRYLVLTCWTIQCRLHRSGSSYDMPFPAEAYVFTPEGCIKLSGWRNSYSGNSGYYITYSPDWRQPKKWLETWGAANKIYGLTPELVARSCIPNCKLDVYMSSFTAERKKYPVSYLRLYQARPNTENLVLNGLPLVLDDLLAEEHQQERGGREVPKLSEIDWQAARPAQMLGLTKEELKQGQRQGWGALFWRLFLGAKRRRERLSSEDIQNAFYLGDENVLELLKWGAVGKSLRYLLRQIELAGQLEWGEDEHGDPIPDIVIDVSMLVDYWDACIALHRSLNNPQVRWPQNLPLAHEAVMALRRKSEKADNEKSLARRFRIRRRQLAQYIYEADGLKIVPAYSQRELQKESDALHHCVWTYAERHARGATAIFFIRRTLEPQKPYYTLELDEHTLTVRQDRGLWNCGRTPEVRAFEARWLAWLRAGAVRNGNGRPVEPEAKTRHSA